ncbi:Hypothetical predicted protein [Cloeon dipterum]|uniref:Uncharacterized protein n=1 Tax=Cloeon dipterum TaxID=197152 RepID=A0A8S1E3J1_9INSE|nr:Hypothetical predicted protein [Cloeon dipterum]
MEQIEEPSGDLTKDLGPTDAKNYKMVLYEIKKNERMQNHQNRESLEVLVQTSILQKQNAQLTEKIAEKEARLKDLTNQIALQTYQAKMHTAARKFVDDARQQLWVKEETRLIQSCKFYEDHWKATCKEIADIYFEIEKQRSIKKDNGKNIFALQSHDWEAIIEETTPAEIPDDVHKTTSESDEFDSQEIQRVLQDCESNYLENPSAKPTATNYKKISQFDCEEEGKSHESVSVSGCHGLGFGNSMASSKVVHTPWRQDAKLPNQLSYQGGAAHQVQQQGVPPMERSRQTLTLPTTGQARGYNQKPMTSHWVTSQFAAKQTSSSKKSAVSSQQAAVANAARTPASRDDFDWDDWGCDIDENWHFEDKNVPPQPTQPNKVAEKKAPTFRPKQPTIKYKQ